MSRRVINKDAIYIGSTSFHSTSLNAVAINQEPPAPPNQNEGSAKICPITARVRRSELGEVVAKARISALNTIPLRIPMSNPREIPINSGSATTAG